MLPMRPVSDDRLGLRQGALAWTVPARAGLLAVCLLALFASAVGITDEGHVSLQGDMPRYVMNGVFVLDAVRDGAIFRPTSLLEYARHYYARYPALSLGHHPPLVPVLEAPLYALFGVSIASARLVEVGAFVAAVALLYLIVLTLYDWIAASIAAVLLATSPFVILLARSVLSEVPAIALVLAAVLFLLRFCVRERRTDLVLFVVAASLSLYAKQLAIFMFPTYVAIVWTAMGGRRLFRWDLFLATGAVLLLSAPLVPITLELSPMNVAITIGPRVHATTRSPMDMARVALQSQLAWPVVALAGIAAARGVLRRDIRVVVLGFWTVTVFLAMVVAAPWEPDRYSVYMVPAICALAASLASKWKRRDVAAGAIVVLCLVSAVQASTGLQDHLPGATGYEEAAKFVLESNPGSTVLFSGDVDSGYFTFFIRKHDPERRLVVLRSDKLLTTSMMARPAIAERIAAPAEIYQQLRTFGTRYIVIEDRPSASRVLEWLRQELRTPNFAERRRIHIGSSDRRLRGTDLVVYEYLAATTPDPGAVLSMNLPLVHQSVAVPLADLINRKYLR